MITSEWKSEVLNIIQQKKDGEIISLTPSHINYNRFIEAVKIIIDWRQDNDNGFELTFNDSYTILKKRCLRQKKEIDNLFKKAI